MSVVVSDTTPLNYLILIGNIDVLPRLFGKVLIPPAVIRELIHPKTPAPVATWTRNLPEWVEVRAPHTILRLGIDAGESEAISLAVELGIAVLMDEHAGRASAEQRGVLVLGTLAVLNIADANGWLEFEAAVSGFVLRIFVSAKPCWERSVPLSVRGNNRKSSMPNTRPPTAARPNLRRGSPACQKKFNKALAMPFPFDNLSPLRFIAWRRFCPHVPRRNSPFLRDKT